MIPGINLHFATVLSLLANWYQIPMTVLLGAGGIFVIVMTIIFARDLAKAVFGDATDGFTEFSRAFFCFYMMLVVTMELLGFGMAIASLWQ